MWIKICANTNLEDARLAADLGAHALGFVFAPSPRHVTPTQVAAIAAQLPAHIETIGVFEKHSAAAIIATAAEAGLTGVQLHSSVDLALITQLQEGLGEAVTLIQAVHWDTNSEASTSLETMSHQLRLIREKTHVRRVLIDSRVGPASGGTGVPFDWKAAGSLLRAELGNLHLVVAGGLRPDNVSEAIEALLPWGVDVASGVEAFPGKKDPEKLKAFLEKASVSTSL